VNAGDKYANKSKRINYINRLVIKYQAKKINLHDGGGRVDREGTCCVC
jgi:hypothetical protein